ncbi:MAG: Gldg family protein [Lachnospiraceae bacterium]|nr:Gldg family protein [Lachnospiraceae bacterium]
MKALIKKELRSYLYSVTGGLFIAVNLLFLGIYFTAYNLTGGYPTINFAINSAIVVFLFITPLLTMRIIAEERRTRTDQLLLSSPMPLLKIIIGKYLALLTILAVPVITAAVYPLILGAFGKVSYSESYVAVLAYFLFGAACLGIGLFISSLTENQIIAAVLTFAALFITYLMNGIVNLLPDSVEIVKRILSLFDISKRLDNLMNGILDIRAVVYYLTIVILTIFLTYESIQKRRFTISSQTVKFSSYSLTAIVAAFALAVGANFLVLKLPDDIMQYDFTENRIFTMSAESKDFLDSLDKDVTIYVLSEKDRVELPVVKTLDEYEAYSDHIHVEYKDISKDPQFPSKFTEDTVTGGDLIVVCGENSRTVAGVDLFETEIDYQTFSQTITGLDAEGQITAAIAGVTSDRKTIMKVMAGHGEFEVKDLGLLFASLKKTGITPEQINLLTVSKIEDCDMILIAAPLDDYSEEDCKKVREYLDGGGCAVILSGYSENGKKLDNFNNLLSDYGVSITEGLIEDTDPAHFYGNNPLYLLPQIYDTPVSKTINAQKRYAFMPYSQAISVNEAAEDSGVSVVDALMTSQDSFMKADLKEGDSLDKNAGDLNGPFSVGVYITKGDTKIALFSSAMAFTDDVYRVVGDANVTLVTDAAKDMSPVVTGPLIPVKSYGTEYITISAAYVILYGLIFIILVPLLILVVSIVLWARRRKK